MLFLSCFAVQIVFLKTVNISSVHSAALYLKKQEYKVMLVVCTIYFSFAWPPENDVRMQVALLINK